MARPRIFISSTIYGLESIRNSLTRFIESLGYDPVLSENGSVPYLPNRSLAESCCEAVRDCNIYVLIIASRYGSAARDSANGSVPGSHQMYDSITRREYRAAVGKGMPIYVLVSRDVYSEFQTYQNNRETTMIKYVQVDSVDVFQFMEEINENQKPIRPFDGYAQIEDWLRPQWAGLFGDLIRRSAVSATNSGNAQSSGISNVVGTMQRILEAGIRELPPEEIATIRDVIRATGSDPSGA